MLQAVAIAPAVPLNVAVSRLALTDFRCFARAVVTTDSRPVVLTGPNGAGKTAVLEALSLLVPGPGFRGARLDDFARRGAAPGGRWAVAARVETADGTVDIGTGQAATSDEPRRAVRIDGKPARGQAPLAEVVSALWLTPAMDRLFTGGAAGRRRFFDRLVLGFDPAHARRLAAYERALRDRARLLREGRADGAWLDAIEHAMAENGVAVAAGRRQAARQLGAVLARGVGPFPGAGLALDGAVENWLDDTPAVDAEARLAAALAESRRHDGEAGGAAHGPHRSDIVARHESKDMPAAQCSTGEQKALLIAIVLSAAEAQVTRRGIAPLLLLDEIVAHLDERHREALFGAIASIGAQAWMTGTDRASFRACAGRAQFFSVRAAAVAAEPE
jgi:DNA replication and repair protein RecF